MKKLFAVMGLLLGIAAVSHAGTPQEQPLPGQIPYSHKTIYVSTYSYPSSGAQVALAVSQAPGSLNDGGASNSCRNCFTRFFVQIPTNTIVSILDGSTTAYTILGAGLGTTGVSTLSLPEDHLGPACFTTGNTTTINTSFTSSGAGSAVLQPTSIVAEGFIQCGRSNQGGSMQ